LLTAKRKARAFKKLLKEELPVETKDHISEYLSLLDQKNFAKNRKWAHQKIKQLLLDGQNYVGIQGS
jgi:hypothetical protein